MGNYQQAIKSFLEARDQEQETPLIDFYLGLSYLSENRSKEALELLEPLSTLPGFQFNEQAQWYSGLAFLKLDQKDKAREIFGSLKYQATDKRIRQRAQRIIKSID